VKTIGIVQSNYIPWKGYFDIIRAVDEFILYDDAQFTKNDWRNRNRIKTPHGVEWLTVPVGQSISRRIRDVELRDERWARKHWSALESSYRRARHFAEVATVLQPIYERPHSHLSVLNRELIEAVCGYLGIRTVISNSWQYELIDGMSARVADLCRQAGGAEYLSGPSARGYLDLSEFARRGVMVRWVDYDGYPEYPQLWGPFVHEVSIVDLLFNCGPDAPRSMKNLRT
jgi:hypothetical protein